MALGILDLISLGQGGVAGISENAYEPIQFPLSVPATPGFRRFRMRQQRSQQVSESPSSLISQVQVSSAERWAADVTLPQMSRARAGEWQGFFNMLDGKVGTFMLGDALGRNPRGTPLGTPKVKDSNQSGKILIVDGCAPETQKWLRAGDYFQIGQRLHQVSRDADSDAGGVVVLDFWPRLREVYAPGTLLITSDCKGLFRMANVQWDAWEADEQQLYTIAFSAEESL